jgi:uncharacterized protein DUF4440
VTLVGEGLAEAELADIERRRLRALVDADVAAADELHAEDFQLVTPSGDAVTKGDYLAGIASGEIDYVRWDPLDVAARVCGDAGCVRYHSILEIVVAGQAVGARRYWHTDYYERRSSGWQVVWSQATEIVNAPDVT